MKYFLFCDFSTMSCDRAKVAEVLSENEILFINHNNFIWELDVPNTFGVPMIDTTAENIHYLFEKYTNRDSFLLVVKADEHFPTEF